MTKWNIIINTYISGKLFNLRILSGTQIKINLTKIDDYAVLVFALNVINRIDLTKYEKNCELSG